MNLSSKNYFIVETAFHHEGDIQFLKDLLNEVLKLDVNAVKFHLLFDVNDYMVSNHPAIEVINKISLDKSYWDEIFTIVDSYSKDIIALTNDVSSLRYVNSIQLSFPIRAIELHSTGLNDIFLLDEACKFNKTIILGVGGSTFDEIQFAIDYLKSKGKDDILLMHGFQNYPTNYSDINFDRIALLNQAFNLPIGYADHTDPLDELNVIMSVFPIGYGVRVFEKHVTHFFGEKRVDAQAAVSIDTMRKIIALGNSLITTIGDTKMQFSNAELNYGNTGPMKKAIVARNKIQEGQIITLKDIAYKRTESSSNIQQKDVFSILGNKAKRIISQDELLTFDNIEYKFVGANFDQFFVKK